MSLLAMPYSATQMVEKVYFYTKDNNISKKDGLLIIASMIEAERLKCMTSLFDAQLAIAKTKLEVTERYSQIDFDYSKIAEVSASIKTMNRAYDYLFSYLKDLLKPVWNVYWGESCSGLATICDWLLKADKDQGTKVFVKLSELSRVESATIL